MPDTVHAVEIFSSDGSRIGRKVIGIAPEEFI